MNTNRSYPIFDISTHAKYCNRRETMKLQDTIKDLSCKQHLAVYRHVMDEKYLKNKLNTFRYESERNKYLAKRKSNQN